MKVLLKYEILYGPSDWKYEQEKRENYVTCGERNKWNEL
jgi:hypothetical protein